MISKKRTNIKTITEPFSIEALMVRQNAGGLLEIMNCRQEAFYNSMEYKELEDKFKKIFQEFEGFEKNILNNLQDYIAETEWRFFDEGYRAGVTDLMTSMIFDNLEIINTEYMCQEE